MGGWPAAGVEHMRQEGKTCGGREGSGMAAHGAGSSHTGVLRVFSCSCKKGRTAAKQVRWSLG